MDDNPETYKEQDLFEKSQDVKTLIKNVNDRLGFLVDEEGESDRVESIDSLFFNDVQLIYDMCRFEAAWNPQNISYWCAAFNEEDLKVPNRLC